MNYCVLQARVCSFSLRVSNSIVVVAHILGRLLSSFLALHAHEVDGGKDDKLGQDDLLDSMNHESEAQMLSVRIEVALCILFDDTIEEKIRGLIAAFHDETGHGAEP